MNVNPLAIGGMILAKTPSTLFLRPCFTLRLSSFWNFFRPSSALLLLNCGSGYYIHKSRRDGRLQSAEGFGLLFDRMQQHAGRRQLQFATREGRILFSWTNENEALNAGTTQPHHPAASQKHSSRKRSKTSQKSNVDVKFASSLNYCRNTQLHMGTL